MERVGSRRIRILKGRQVGITTLYSIDNLDNALWNPGFSACIISHERQHLDNVFQIIKRAYENLPEAIKPVTRQDTLRSYRFEKTFDGQKLDSEIYVALKLRGGTVQSLHVTERAKITGEDSQELEAGSKQAVPMGGTITEETTANGFDAFYDGFMEGLKSDRKAFEYKSFFYAWHENPEYSLVGTVGEYTKDEQQMIDKVRIEYKKTLMPEQILWYRYKLGELKTSSKYLESRASISPEQLMKQEYPSFYLEAFQVSSGNVFDQMKLDGVNAKEPAYQKQSKKFPSEKISVWHNPFPGARYFIGVDPGEGGDPCGLAVWDEYYKKCAEWSGSLRPDHTAELAKEIAIFYNNAFVGIENNMLSTILFFVKIYDNYFSTVRVDEKTQRQTKKIGWTTSSKSRDLMIDDFMILFDEGSLDINSKLTQSQMKTFVYKDDGKREHADGKHDDMLFADMIAIQMIKYKHKARSMKRAFNMKPQGF